MGIFCLSFTSSAFGQGDGAFRAFTWEWPSPNETRLASGAPGPMYWQQRANYDIGIRLDDAQQKISGSETLVYSNNSPHSLAFLWLQIDQNIRKPNALSNQINSSNFYSSQGEFDRHFQPSSPFKGGIEDLVVTQNGEALKVTVVETNARVNLPEDLLPGQTVSLKLSWSYRINNARDGGRCGYEYFPEDGNYIYEIAQFYPRVCTYDDVYGWENRPFLGDAEFGLEFGDFELAVDVPTGYLVTATGALKNESEVLTKTQRDRLKKLEETQGQPQFIVTAKEAALASRTKPKGRKTWRFSARNVRDMAFAASRKFIWDAAEIELGNNKVRAQSFYPKEGMPLWDKYATHAIIHTLQTYSKLTFDFPYPVATAVHGPVWGMEYPMLAFCGGRPTSSGYYSRQAKYRMIGVVMHEVGHNYFPMIVNSNERRWAWMDEGFNSFCQIIAEESFEKDFLLRRGHVRVIDALMKGQDHQAILTSPDELRDNSTISYHKTALGLNILRNEILGPSLFDDAFKAYANRWAFRHPEPSDFFRTIEDVAGHDLSWFWRTWFYENADFEMGISRVMHCTVTQDADEKSEYGADPHAVAHFRLPPTTYYSQARPELKDRYTGQEYKKLQAHEVALREILENSEADTAHSQHVYQVLIERKGRGILPLQLEAWLADGSSRKFQIPAQVWIKGNNQFVKEIISEKELVAIMLDPEQVVPDLDRSNNFFPRKKENLKFEVPSLRN